MEALIVLSAVAAGAAGLWAAKLLEERARREAAIEEREHDVNIAELVVMAILADGLITTAEWGVVRGEFGARGYSLLAADQVIARLRAEAERVRAAGELGAWVTQQGRDLSAADRELVYEMVVDLSLSGSKLDAPSGEYRSQVDGAPRHLLQVFGDGLAIPEERRRAINLAHLRRSDAPPA